MAQDSPLDRLSALDTNTVSDALDFLGLNGATYGFRPLWKCPKIVGRVRTVKVSVDPYTSPPIPPPTAVFDEGEADDRILVISGGIHGVSCWDDIIDNAWKSNSIRGAIIDGMCRDNDDVRQSEYPVYGRGLVDGHHQSTQVSFGFPVQIRGSEVHQDDYVIADCSGVVFLSAERIERVLEASESIRRRQALLAQAVQTGRPVSETMSEPQFGAVRNPNPSCAEDKELVALFAGSDTPAVSDALDKLGIPGQALKIMPLTNYTKVTVGPAFTVRYVPAGDPPGGVGNWIDDVAQGDMIVIDNGSRTDCTIWGDLMTQYAGIRGISGTVIDGVCRDVNRAITDDYPMFTRGRFMRTAKDRVQLASVNESIGIGGVHVKPRDIVVADANGVVIVPRDRAREVAELAQWVSKCEESIREMIASGATLGKAREELNYHQLQRRA
ncbi:putative demethylmenaquinone methyltransferase [Penicillium hispanicum]|uniref:putative demethylmenaquinone methyltransferase n=1 Tax=Penicillium hispanicum TaxID=1080232 RepID=UPI0025403E8A|nr:putative demethylmenaquinone methyltransferase [Penicillium hispanicum]KAJ5574004.1 putative demethylmenaquinone methyltransferase [Penicillium hispanicum]